MNKKIIPLLSINFIALLTVSCSAPKTKAAIEMYTSSKPITTEYFEYDFDLSKYTVLEESPTVEKSIVGLLFCANIAPSSLLKFENSEFVSKDCDDYLALYQQLKLDDFYTQEILSKNELDINDQSRVNIAHKKFDSNNKTYDIGFVSVIDSGGGVQWISNFDVGYDNDVYATTGEHPEWTDHLAHKGFDVTSNRCMPVIEDYIASKMDKDAEKIIYVYGHSRGGAVGNLVAKKLIDKGYTTTAYLFAGPNTTTANDVNDAKYKRIFNYVNEKDIICSVPSTKWGFTRYGQTTTFDGTANKEHFKEINHVSMPSGDSSKVISFFEKVASSREAIYTFSDELLIGSAKDMETEEQAQLFIKSYMDLVPEGMEECKNFIKTEITQADGKYSARLITCPALFTSMVSRVVSVLFTSGISGDAIPSGLMTFLQPFLKVGGLSTADLISLAGLTTYILYNHYYHCYVPYFVK